MKGSLYHLFRSLPVGGQQLGIDMFGWYQARKRFGPIFDRISREYKERETWPAERMRGYIEERLRGQLRRAYEQVPYYRRMFGEYGITGSMIDIFTLDDLRLLPVLEKSVVRSDSDILLTEDACRHKDVFFQIYTSGTTGKRIRIYVDVAMHQHTGGAREARSLDWAGVSYHLPRTIIGGRQVVPGDSLHPPFWRYNRWERQLYLSAFHINPSNIKAFVEKLNEYKALVMMGYASSNYFLARLIEEEGLEVYSPKVVIASGERLETFMRDTIERVFHARVTQEYGSSENCALATECEYGTLHINPDFGLVEILREDGTPADKGETGEMVVTGFANTNQIFIRYRSGDMAAWAEKSCPCGRDTLPPLCDNIKRCEDMIFGPQGCVSTALHTALSELPGVVAAQLIRKSDSAFTVNIVPAAGYQPGIEQLIKVKLTELLGKEVAVDIRELAFIPREANGKFRALIATV